MSSSARSGATRDGADDAVRALVRVPGKVMLAGEYSVLGGGRALASPVAATMTVTADTSMPEGDEAGVTLVSSHWRAARTLGAAAIPGRGGVEEPFAQAVRAAMQRYGRGVRRVEIDSALDPRHGLGSSSALRLGVTLAVRALAAGRALTEAERWECAREAYLLQRAAQPRASGYDVAVQVGGGPALFRVGDEGAWPGTWATLGAAAGEALAASTTVMVGGRGAATAPVMQDVLAWMAEARHAQALAGANESLIDAYLTRLRAVRGDEDGATRGLVAATAAQRAVLETAPHFPQALAAALREVEGLDSAWSYKTTGAGGEDALLLVGDAARARARLEALGWQPLRGASGASPFVLAGVTLAVHPTRDAANAPDAAAAAREPEVLS